MSCSLRFALRIPNTQLYVLMLKDRNIRLLQKICTPYEGPFSQLSQDSRWVVGSQPEHCQYLLNAKLQDCQTIHPPQRLSALYISQVW